MTNYDSAKDIRDIGKISDAEVEHEARIAANYAKRWEHLFSSLKQAGIDPDELDAWIRRRSVGPQAAGKIVLDMKKRSPEKGPF